MAEAPYHNEVPTDALCIDRDKITDSHDSNDSAGWVRSPPLTRTVSKTYLDSMNTEWSMPSSRPRPAPKIPRKAVGTAPNSQSIPSPLPSPTFSDDQHDPLISWNGSEASLVDHGSYPDYEEEQPHAEKWESWFPTTNDSRMQSSFSLAKPKSVSEVSTLSNWNRNYGSTNLSDLDVSKSKTSLLRSHPRPSPIRQKKLQSSYTAFPSTNTETNHFHDVPRRPHKSWPGGASQDRPVLRARANTTPLNFKSHRPSHRPSNLSVCTTLDYESPRSTSTSSTPLYMCSPQPSPQPAQGLMEYMSQQSYFFNSDDSDDEEQTWIATQKQKWHRRVFSKDHAPALDEPPRLVARPQKKKKKISLGKSVGLKDVFVFGRKRKEDKKDVRLCPKCWKEVERLDGSSLMVTCSCHADLCFGCLRDWDFCDGRCESVK